MWSKIRGSCCRVYEDIEENPELTMNEIKALRTIARAALHYCRSGILILDWLKDNETWDSTGGW